ncbi:MAG: family 20 glycosylhydrolase, partial [Lachnospiraceae bacterium]|nr:family 20 glycosylhydrolase [Lachnospiraceae bacterium]
PEIDLPAHSLAFTSKFKELSLKAPEAADQLDLSKIETWELAEGLWQEQTENFSDCPLVHIGGDEYFGNPDEYHGFMEYLAENREREGKNVRLWGSLSKIKGSGTIPAFYSQNPSETSSQKREMLIWNTYWADPREMREKGFSLINANHGELYLIPGGGQDWLDKEDFYQHFAVNRFPLDGPDGLPTGDAILMPKEALTGAQLTLWNDFTGTIENGMDEQDMLLRLRDAIPYFAQKTWHGEETVLEYEQFQNLISLITL